MVQNTNIKKVVIVGGVAGGANAAARLKRLNESLEIVVFERSGYVSFANCGLPYHIGNEISDRTDLLLHTPASLRARFDLDVRVHSEVLSINKEKQTVSVKEVTTGREYTKSYDALILAPGAAPFRPAIEGLELPGIYSLRNIEDMDAITARFDTKIPRHILIVGGGFVGLEMLEQLHAKFGTMGTTFTLIERNQHILTPLDDEMVTEIEQTIRSKGVNLIVDDAITGFKSVGEKLTARTQRGMHIDTDFVLFNVGVRPETTLAVKAGLEIGARGGIKVDDQMRTSDPNIYAVGDCIETKNLITGEYGVTPLAGPANRQGRIVADVINGIDTHYKGTLGTAIVRVFDLTAAVTGANERTLRRLGIPYEAIYLHPNSHAGYYPGAHPIHLKLIFSPKTRRVLGAQAVGKDGVDKRIDIIASALFAELTVDDLTDLELCYAPPFGSAKDPINLAGMVAQNTLNGFVASITPQELDRVSNDTLLLDVRSGAERGKGYISGSLHIPLPELRARIHEIPRDKELIVYCHSGLRSYNACRILMQHGFRCKNLSGAYATWKLHGS